MKVDPLTVPVHPPPPAGPTNGVLPEIEPLLEPELDPLLEPELEPELDPLPELELPGDT